MIRPGLVSISFRKIPPRDIVQAAKKAGLGAIEWGGDVHVPHGDEAKAREVCRMTVDAGLVTAAYGSYYCAGEKNAVPFSAVVQSARALNTRLIRVWAGKRASKDADAPYREAVAQGLVACAEEAGKQGITVATEFHGGTLTDTLDSCQALHARALHPFLRNYWQPPVGMTPTEALVTLEALLPRLVALHVFHWWPKQERLPLQDGLIRWKGYLACARKAAGLKWALLEFVPGDALENLAREAKTLLELLETRRSPGD